MTISGFSRESTLLIIGNLLPCQEKNHKLSIIILSQLDGNFRAAGLQLAVRKLLSRRDNIVIKSLGFFPSMAQGLPMTNKELLFPCKSFVQFGTFWNFFHTKKTKNNNNNNKIYFKDLSTLLAVKNYMSAVIYHLDLRQYKNNLSQSNFFPYHISGEKAREIQNQKLF